MAAGISLADNPRLGAYIRVEYPATDTGTTLNCEMMKIGTPLAALGASLKHASDVCAARILVIEDNGSDVFLLDRALHRQDFRFELMHLFSGGAALEFIHREGAYKDAPVPNLILVDLNLSKYTGEDILCEIRSAKHLAGVPVCVWSSSRSRRDEAVLKEMGVAQFITKPSGLNQFMEIGKTLKDLLTGPAAA